MMTVITKPRPPFPPQEVRTTLEVVQELINEARAAGEIIAVRPITWKKNDWCIWGVTKMTPRAAECMEFLIESNGIVMPLPRLLAFLSPAFRNIGEVVDDEEWAYA